MVYDKAYKKKGAITHGLLLLFKYSSGFYFASISALALYFLASVISEDAA